MLLAPNDKTLNLLGFGPTGDLGPLTGYTSKRRRPVFFLKSPPTSPPTQWQTRQRNVFRLLARNWQALTPAKRAAWQAAAFDARLNITGHNLFVWYHSVGDPETIRTIENQTGINLLT